MCFTFFSLLLSGSSHSLFYVFTEQKERMTSDDLLATLFLIQFRVLGFFCKGILLACVELAHQECHIPLWKTTFQPAGPQPVLEHVLIPFWVQNLLLPIPELPARPSCCQRPCHLLLPIRYFLQTFWGCCPSIQVTQDDAKCYWTYISWPYISSMQACPTHSPQAACSPAQLAVCGCFPPCAV